MLRHYANELHLYSTDMLKVVNSHEMSIVVAASPRHWWKIQCHQCLGAFRSTVTSMQTDRRWSNICRIMFHNFDWKFVHVAVVLRWHTSEVSHMSHPVKWPLRSTCRMWGCHFLTMSETNWMKLSVGKLFKILVWKMYWRGTKFFMLWTFYAFEIQFRWKVLASGKHVCYSYGKMLPS